ncbi:AAA family ATPase [Candidatus Dependentiae bacterium]|nr:AAA family ATPase [Candidatus Dependentiae bacterium]
MNRRRLNLSTIILLTASSIAFSTTMPTRARKDLPNMKKSKFPYLSIPEENRKSLKGAISKKLEEIFTSIANKRTLPPGLFFYGKKGIGKTLTAQALTGELDGYAIHFDTNEIIEAGNCNSTIKRIFTYARNCVKEHNKYVIIFFDDIHEAGKNGSQSPAMRSFTTTLCSEIKKERENHKILVIAATYEKVEKIHSLFIKSPFETVKFEEPDTKSRFAILEYYFRKSSYFRESHIPVLKEIAERTSGLTARDLKLMVNIAKRSVEQRYEDSNRKTKLIFSKSDLVYAYKQINILKVKEDGSFSLTRVAEGSVVATVGAIVGFVIAIIAGSNGGNGGNGGSNGSPTGSSSV